MGGEYYDRDPTNFNDTQTSSNQFKQIKILIQILTLKIKRK